jgi:hypothetical protein
MATTTVTLGPGTLTIGSEDPATTDFSCEVAGGQITHTYEDIGEQRTMLCGDVKAAERVRRDGLAFDIENDLSGTGLYKFLLDNDLQERFFKYVPNTAAGASWDGKMIATLPGSIGADQFGSPIVSSVEWTGVGTFNFTPATAPAEPGA